MRADPACSTGQRWGTARPMSFVDEVTPMKLATPDYLSSSRPIRRWKGNPGARWSTPSRLLPELYRVMSAVDEVLGLLRLQKPGDRQGGPKASYRSPALLLETGSPGRQEVRVFPEIQLVPLPAHWRQPRRAMQSTAGKLCGPRASSEMVAGRSALSRIIARGTSPWALRAIRAGVAARYVFGLDTYGHAVQRRSTYSQWYGALLPS